MAQIGSPEWIENVTKAAMNNRANQLNPSCSTYWKCRDCRPVQKVDPLLGILAAAAIGAAATAATIFGVQKLVQWKKERDAEHIEEEDFAENDLEEIPFEDDAEDKEEEAKEEE